MHTAGIFKGRIGRTVPESEPSFEESPHAPDDAPNVVVILLDDTGFAQFGCYGSDIDTSHIDALATDGLQFTNFHVTPLCSPTRAALLTGRAHHAVGMRSLANFRTGFPNMTGHLSDEAATIADVLHHEGYATFCVGKWHLAPMEQCSAAGPFDHWPLARGFDRFYGFLDGETDQFHPTLASDNHPIDTPATAEEGYHLSEDLVDHALEMIADTKGVRPDRPFFTYLAFGATHAPHQAPQRYLEKYRGTFDEGWDVVRQRWYQRQLDAGIIPADTELAPHNPGVDPWDDLPENQQRLAARLQEAFAAFLDHTDDQIGRFVDGLRSLGQLDNTLLFVLSDNGASQEGGPFGVLHEMKFFNGILEEPDEAVLRLDDIGGPHSHANYPWGWAQTGNSPFKWYKQNTHEGGVHVPLVVHLPEGLADGQHGTQRHQFAHASDVAPTIYDLLGITPKSSYRGVEQLPVSGKSFASIITDPNAPATNTLQYFEMNGSRALVAGEWKAVCRHMPNADYDTEPWELYHLTEDASECHDLADTQPERLSDLIDLWWSEAEQNGVLPLDDRLIELFAAKFRPHAPHNEDQRYVYRPPMSPMPAQASAQVGGRAFDLTAQVTRSAGDAGALYATGSENAGFALFVQDDRLWFDYNAFGDHVIVESTSPVPVGHSTLEVRVRRDEHRTGTAELFIDGHTAGSGTLPLFMGVISSIGASVGRDQGSPVSDRYTAPFTFTGTLHEVRIQLSPHRHPDSAQAEANAEMGRQ